jgi:hypothetical protein
MKTYPFLTAQILSEQLFVMYGGHTGTATAAQVAGALAIAERQMTEQLGTYLVPVTVTGTYYVNNDFSPLVLEVGRIREVKKATFHFIESLVTGTYTDYPGIAQIRDAESGFVDIRFHIDSYPCCQWQPGPYEVEVVFTSGMDTGTSMNEPGLHMGLAAAADLVLNEMIDPGGSEVQVGVQDWSSMRYRENRTPLHNTAFGMSARANYISRLVEHLKVRRVGRI